MIDLEILKNMMAEIRENDDLLDSLSPNQFNTKMKLIESVNKLDFLSRSTIMAPVKPPPTTQILWNNSFDGFLTMLNDLIMSIYYFYDVLVLIFNIII